MPDRLSLANIEEASRVIDPVFRDSPQIAFDTLSEILGAETVLKVETLNPIRSFKGRGPSYYVHQLKGKTPLIAASAGSYGQGLAVAARARGIPFTVFAAEKANPLKVARMRALGAEVVLGGDDFDAAKALARAHAEQNGFPFVEDGKEPAVSEGAGSMAVELLQWPDPFDAVLVALGNGALINGIGAWVKAHAPETEVIGVCATGAPSMQRSWASGSMVTTDTVDTIADGIGVRVPVPEALDDMKDTVDDVVLVDDQTTLKAMRLLLHHTGLLIEPSGAVGVAAMLTDAARFQGKRVATILCGSNVTEAQFQAWFAAGDNGGSE